VLGGVPGRGGGMEGKRGLSGFFRHNTVEAGSLSVISCVHRAVFSARSLLGIGNR